MKIKSIGHQANRQTGYTLISVAISLIIIGLITSAGIASYSIYLEKKKIKTTEDRVHDAVAQIETFRQINGRYPCPSSLTAPRNNAAYGQENEADCINAGPAIPAGTCLNGICVINSDPSRVATAPTVRIGALPFRAMQIDEKDTYDAYGSRLVYAVTERLAVENTFSEVAGGIGIIDENGNSVLTPAGTANFIVISNGPNRIGAYSIEGTQSTACPASGSSLEEANCINMASLPSNANFRSSFAALAGGATQFDDTIDYFSTVFDPSWKRITTTPNNIESLSTNNLGAGVLTPSQTLDIGSNLKSNAGFGLGRTWDGGLRVSSDTSNTSLQTDRLCQKDGSMCFDIADFTGSTGIKCTNPGEYMIGIEGTGTNAKAKCAAVMVQCPSGQVLKGVLASGQPDCSVAYSNCSAGTIQICDTSGNFTPRNSYQTKSNAIAIGSGTHGSYTSPYIKDLTAYSFSANPKQAQFLCYNGNWLYTGLHAGFCGNNCTPPAWAGSGPTYSGTTSSSTTVSCTGAMGSYGETTTVTTSCSFSLATCSPSCSNSTAACNCQSYFPVDMSGNPTTGPSGNPPPAKPSNIISACGTGYNTGNLTTSYVWDKTDAVCNWKTGPTASTCTCDPTLAGSAPNTDPGKDCSTLIAGTAGTAPAVWAFDSTAGQCKWKVTGYDTSICSCDTSAEYISAASHAPTCNTACDNETTPAVWAYKYKLDGSGNCVKDTEYIKTPAVCGYKPFTWIAITKIDSDSVVPTGVDQCNTGCRTSPVSPPVTTPPYATVGGSACPELNSPGSCWRAEGTYNTYTAKCMAN